MVSMSLLLSADFPARTPAMRKGHADGEVQESRHVTPQRVDVGPFDSFGGSDDSPYRARSDLSAVRASTRAYLAAAVDVQVGAARETGGMGRGQEEHAIGHLLRPRHPAQRAAADSATP